MGPSLVLLYYLATFLYTHLDQQTVSALIVALYLAAVIGFKLQRRRKRAPDSRPSHPVTRQTSAFRLWLARIAAQSGPFAKHVSDLLWLMKWAAKYAVLLISIFLVLFNLVTMLAAADLLTRAFDIPRPVTVAAVLVGAIVLTHPKVLGRRLGRDALPLYRLAQRRTTRLFDAWRAELNQA